MDEEAVKRFLEYRAEIRRKQNIKIIRVVSVLAVFIGFILCYTLIPRSWDIASREADPNRITGSRHTFTFYHGEPEIDLWTINQEEADGPAVSAFMDAFRAGSYRAELRNILSHTPLGAWLDTSVQGSSNTVILALVRDDTILTSVMLFDTYDHEIHINLDGDTYFYHDDGTLYDTISALVVEYGVYQD